MCHVVRSVTEWKRLKHKEILRLKNIQRQRLSMIFVPGSSFRMVGRLMSFSLSIFSKFDGPANHAVIKHRNKSLRHDDGHSCNKQPKICAIPAIPTRLARMHTFLAKLSAYSCPALHWQMFAVRFKARPGASWSCNTMKYRRIDLTGAAIA